MKIYRLFKKLLSGLPYISKEIRYFITKNTPFFIAVPSNIYINLMNLPCNGRCIMCSTGIANSKGAFVKKGDIISGEMLMQRLKEARALSGRGLIVSFAGGEPLLYKPLLSLAKLSHELGINFSFTTNGYLLTEKTVQEFMDYDLFNIGISIESLDPTVNEIIRPVKNGTQKAVNGIEYILSQREKNNSQTTVNIKITLTNVNYRSFIDIVKKYGRRDGVIITPQPFTAFPDIPRENIDKLWVQDVEDFKNFTNNLLALKKEGYAINADTRAIEGFVEHFKKGPEYQDGDTENISINPSSSHKDPCTIGDTTLFIEWNGDVHLCPFFGPIGNINSDTSIRDMWYGKEAQSIRKKISSCNINCTLSCTRNLSFWSKVKLFLKR